MFWLAFISIILFILFLIIILITTGRSTTDKNLRSLKEELEEKNRKLLEKKSAPKKEKKRSKPAPSVEPEPSIDKKEHVETVVEEIPPVESTEKTSESPVSEVTEPEVEVKAQKQEEAPELFIEEIQDESVPLPQEEVPVAVEPEKEAAAERSEPPMEEVLEARSEKVEEEADDYDYPPFDNTRTMEEFGLSKEEANDFIVDLIQQIEDEMPALITAVEANDSKQIEDISHMIKGSATNLGTGGVADVLIAFNTYMKTDNDPKVIAKYMRHLTRALEELKVQFQ